MEALDLTPPPNTLPGYPIATLRNHNLYGRVRSSNSAKYTKASIEDDPHISGDGRSPTQNAGRLGSPNS